MRSIHLSEQSEDHHRQLGDRIIRVGGINLDGIGQGKHSDLTLLEIMNEVERVAHGAPQPVEGVDDDDITRASLIECFLEFGAVGGGSGFLVGIDVFVGDTFLAQGIDLAVEALFRGTVELKSLWNGLSWDYAFSLGLH